MRISDWSSDVCSSDLTGGWKAPTRFLPCGRSTAVLPPTEESTIASSVVGGCTQSMPRIQHAAAKPARSPTTPPPSAYTQASRVAPSAASASMASPRSEEHTSALQSLMRISYAVLFLKKKKTKHQT